MQDSGQDSTLNVLGGLKFEDLTPTVLALPPVGYRAAVILLIVSSQRKPIQQLKAASALTRILVLCDNTLTLLNMFNLEVIRDEISQDFIPISGFYVRILVRDILLKSGNLIVVCDLKYLNPQFCFSFPL